MPPESLNDTNWTIVTIDQMPVLDDVQTEIRFADGRVSGTAGCNRFTGSYSVKGNDLSFGLIAATKMICPEKQLAQETKFLALLNGKVTTRYTVDGNLILAAETGQRTTLKQVI